MISIERNTLDPRAWLLWGAAASLPPLTGRNPFVLGVTVMAVLIVWLTVQRFAPSPVRTAGLLRIAVVFVAIGVIFNALTVRSGDVKLATIPASIPLLDGSITLNAVVYGVLGGVAVLSMVVAGLTIAAGIEWSSLIRLLPDSLAGMGAAASIALTFFPQMVTSYRELREARAIRGAPLHSVWDYASLAAPLLAGGLERAVTLAELLETRGFGSSAATARPSNARRLAMIGGLTAGCAFVFAFAVGRTDLALAAGIVSGLCFGLLVLGRTNTAGKRSRYRPAIWTKGDSFVAGCSVATMTAMAMALGRQANMVGYEPYPTLDAPRVSVALLLALCLLISPAIVMTSRDRP